LWRVRLAIIGVGISSLPTRTASQWTYVTPNLNVLWEKGNAESEGGEFRLLSCHRLV
jgi:hypothetical protein